MLTVKALTLSIGAQSVCNALSLMLPPGESLAILGRNGVGKSTLLATLAGLRSHDTGSITLNDQPLSAYPVRSLARLRGFCPQHVQDAFQSTVRETALIGRHPHLERWAFESAEDFVRVEAALAAVGLSDLSQREVHALSGGERQRLAIATLLVQDPQWLLLDEPLSHLDLHHAIEILTLLKAQCLAGKGVVAVLHDPNLAYRFFDNVLLLQGDGQWQFGPAHTLLSAANLQALYGHPMQTLQQGTDPWFVPSLTSQENQASTKASPP